MNSTEAALRNEIGLDRLMWGVDFPHVEGTWPRTRKSLARCFKGIPIADVKKILSETPARVYGFDIETLQPIADQVGPTVDELVGTERRD
jgi:predicted TIM-barrel fold metal-dependent hydrolase